VSQRGSRCPASVRGTKEKGRKRESEEKEERGVRIARRERKKNNNKKVRGCPKDIQYIMYNV
jgi:hypothetical protein